MLISIYDFLKEKLVIKTNKEEKLKDEIDNSIKFLKDRLPEKRWSNRHYIRPYFVSFDIPGTKNEAFLLIDGMRDEEVTFRVDVVKKGTQRVYSHYLKSCPHSRIEYYFYNMIDREEIYNSIIQLSKKIG